MSAAVDLGDMNKAENVIRSTNNWGEALELAEERSISSNYDWDNEIEVFTFDDNSTLTFTNSEYFAGDRK